MGRKRKAAVPTAAPVAMAYRAFLAARAARAKAKGSASKEATRKMMEAALAAKRAYCLPSNRTSPPDSRLIEELPTEIALFDAEIEEEALAGSIPKAIRPLIRPGTRATTAEIRLDMEAAVRYIRACDGGLINNAHPLKVVASKYGVAEKTLYGWIEKHSGPETDPEQFHPEFQAKEKREEISRLMRNAAKSYRLHGNSHAARRERGRKPF